MNVVSDFLLYVNHLKWNNLIGEKLAMSHRFHVLLHNYAYFLIVWFYHEIDDFLEFEDFGIAIRIEFERFCAINDFHLAVAKLIEVIEFDLYIVNEDFVRIEE